MVFFSLKTKTKTINFIKESFTFSFPIYNILLDLFLVVYYCFQFGPEVFTLILENRFSLFLEIFLLPLFLSFFCCPDFDPLFHLLIPLTNYAQFYLYLLTSYCISSWYFLMIPFSHFIFLLSSIISMNILIMLI